VSRAAFRPRLKTFKQWPSLSHIAALFKWRIHAKAQTEAIMLVEWLPTTVGARIQVRNNRDLERKIEAFNFQPTQVKEAVTIFVRMAPNHILVHGSERARREPVSESEAASITVLDEGQRLC